MWVVRIAEGVAAISAVVFIVANLASLIQRYRQSRRTWLPLLLLCILPNVADAACSGSGLAWTCTAGSTAGQINTAISSASNQAVVTLADGTYSATGIDLSGKNGISVVCASVGGCTMTGASTVFSLTSCASTLTNLVRISGFNFTGASTIAIWIYCNSDIQKLRLDHLDFNNIGLAALGIFLGEGSTPPSVDLGHIYGVVDHVNCHGGANNFVCMKNVAGGMTWTTGTQGSANALFFEDNICNFTGRNDFGTGCIDNWRAQSTVARFNTVTGTVLRAHSMCHGGPQSMEIYGNQIDSSGVSSPGFWDIHLQGAGENIIWGNKVTSGSTPIALQHYRSDASQMPQGDCVAAQIADGTQTGVGAPDDPNDGNRTPLASYYGYPAWHQPGRDGSATLKPVYAFLNTYIVGGANAPVAIESGTWTGSSAQCANTDAGRINCHIQLNRDLYQYTASFTGASGTGSGTLAARPSTCTPTPEAADAGNGGVGYWATDQGSWNQSASNPQGAQQNGADGVLYRCSATNTWTVAYTPYTYPHPLQGQTFTSGTMAIFLRAWWVEAITITGMLWHARKMVASVLLASFACVTTVSTAALPYVQRTVYVAKHSTAHVLVKLLPRKP